MRWERLANGCLRFYGISAMRSIRELVQDDDAYTWSLPYWPLEFIDVYPKNVEAQETLLGIVGKP